MIRPLQFAILFAASLVIFQPNSASGGPYSDAVISDGAIHYWRFEEQSTAIDASDEIFGVPGQNNNPGTYQGNATVGHPSVTSNLGSAVRFDGSVGTHVALGTPQHPGNSMSAEAWFNLDADASAAFSPIIARWDGSYELDINSSDSSGPGPDRVDFVLRNEADSFGDPASNIAITRGSWHHVAGVYDATTGFGTVYLDGVAGQPFSLGGNLADAGGDDGLWYIGTTRTTASTFVWKGLIDEVAIYDYALSVEQINEHIRLASVPEPSALTLAAFALLGLTRQRRRIEG